MSRPEDLPRSASPLKRRAPSLPSDENADVLDDVDMSPVPASKQNTPIGDADSIQGEYQGAQEVDIDGLNAEPSAPAITEENDPNIPVLLDSSEVDRATFERTQVGSDTEDNALSTVARTGDDTQDQARQQGTDNDQDSTAGKAQNKTGPSSTISEDTAESDAKTADTPATSASVEASNKPCKSP